MSAQREPIRGYPARKILTAGPFAGMRDARETTAQTADRVLLARNLYVAKGGGGRAYVGRPGFAPMGAQAGTLWQALDTWYTPSGSAMTVGVRDGEVYRYDWGTLAWVKALSAAQLSPSLLASTGRVQLIPFASGLVFNDRVNKPTYWTGADGTGVTALTNAPVAWWGWVKSAKLVFINAANRLEIQWCEENQPNTGYAVGGYNNAWELRQLSNAPLTAGIGLNDGQLLFRERSTFSIQGEIGPDFSAASTRADVSSTLGTSAPWSVFATDQGVVFVDADAKPWVVSLGGTPEPLWGDCLEQLAASLIPRAQVPNALTLEDRGSGELLIGYPSSASTKLTRWLAFDRDSLSFEGVWDGCDADMAGMIVTNAGESRWAHAIDGNVYLHGAPGVGPWSDQLRAGTVPIAHVLETACLGRDLTEELFVDTVEIGLSASQVSTLTLTVETPQGVMAPQNTILPAAGGARLDQFVLGVDKLGDVSRDRRAIVGTSAFGRWARLIARHTQPGEPISITDLRAVVYADGADPDVF